MGLENFGGAGGSGGVTSIDGITGNVTLVQGTGITIQDNTPSAGNITISSTGGGNAPGGVQYDVQLNDGSGGFAGSNNLNFQGGFLTINGDSGYGQLQWLNSPITGGYGGSGINGTAGEIIPGAGAGDLSIWASQNISFGGNTGGSIQLGIDGATGKINIPQLTASELTATDASSNLQSLDTATYPSLTEISYVKGVTSAIQTQLNAKGSGTVTSVTGTTNRITSTGGVTPVIDISASYVGQSSITTLGTIGTGAWQGSIVTGTYGGTGVNNGASLITLGGNLTTSGAHDFTATLTGNTNVTFPTSGTLSTTTGTVTAVSVASANGFAGSSSGGATPALTISTSITGVLLGNGTSISASNVTNDAQTKSAIVPNTAPSSGQILVGNAGGTAYAPVSMSADATLASTGALTIANNTITTVKINAAAVTYAKIQNVAAASLLGNPTGSPAATSEITLGSGLAFSGTTLTASGSGGTVTTTGSPASGNIAKFSGSTSVTNGDLSGDITTSGTLATTLATVNANTGSFGSSTAIPNFTVNAKGLLTAAGTNAVIAPAGTVTGTTLASNVVTSSLTTVGTIGTGIWQGTKIGDAYGGTNADSSASTGVAQVNSGTWSWSTALANGTTATTQTPSDNSTKVATTAYVASAILGQDFKEACKYASTGPLPSIVYANGSSGVGATLTGVALAAISLDSSSPSVNDRVLIKNQVSTFQNGIYVVTATGSGVAVFILTRSADFNQSSEIDTGDSVFVSSGTTQSTTTWAYNGIDQPVIGTDAITFAQTAGQGSFTAGNGISITGVSIAIDTSVTVDKTTAQTLTNKTLTAPVLTSPTLGTPASGVATNLTGTASGLTAGSVTNATFITALTVNTGTVTLTGNVANTSVLTIGAGAVSISGSNTGDQTIILTGAVTGSGTGSFATTIATPGTLTVSTSNSTATAHTHAITSSSAPGATASLLATDSSGIIGSTGTRIVKIWATDLTVTNNISGSITGNSATATALQNARNIGAVSFDGTTDIVPQTIQSINEATDTTCFPLFITASGTQSLQPKNNTSLTFNSNTGALGATSFSGAGTGLTGTAASLTAGTVSTNANLTGAITSSGNATSLGSFTSANLLGALTDETGSGSAVFATSPTLVTPALGTPTALVGTNITGTASSLTSGITNALASATTTINVASATAPTSGQVLTATSGTAATWQTIGGTGTVTNVATGTGLTGGPVTTTGTISIANGSNNTLAGFNGSGVFSGVAIGTNLTLSGGTLNATGGGGGTNLGLVYAISSANIYV